MSSFVSGDLEEVVPTEVDLLRLDRFELHVHVPPASLFVFHRVSPPNSWEVPARVGRRPAATDVSDISLLHGEEGRTSSRDGTRRRVGPQH